MLNFFLPAIDFETCLNKYQQRCPARLDVPDHRGGSLQSRSPAFDEFVIFPFAVLNYIIC